MTALPFALHKLMTRAELAGLIDGAGPPGPLSPRTLLDAPKQLGPPATGSLGDAANVLRDPHSRITLRIWGGEEASAETTVLFPADPAAGGGYLLNDVEGNFDVSGPVDAEQILALVAPLLPPSAQDIPFVAELEPTTMAVLAAVIDIARDDVRQDRIARVLDGRRMPDSLLADLHPLAPARLAAHLDAWWVLSRFDQLLTYAVALGGKPKPPQQSAVATALLQLSEARLIAIDDKLHVTPTSELARLVEAAFGLCAGFQWQRVATLGDGSILIVERIVLPCAGGRILDLSVTPEGLVRLALAGREEVTAFLIGELTSSPAAAPPTTAAPRGAVQARRFCGHCGHPVAAADRFCGACGGELT
jgi:hypothetical protein